MREEFTMMDWILLMGAGGPITGLLDGEFETAIIYCAIQATALLITYFLRRKGIVTSGSPLRHYILGFIIGHVIYVVICVCVLGWSLSHGTLI